MKGENDEWVVILSRMSAFVKVSKHIDDETQLPHPAMHCTTSEKIKSDPETR